MRNSQISTALLATAIAVTVAGCSSFGNPEAVDNQLVAVRVDPDLNASLVDVRGVTMSDIAYRETVEVSGPFKRNVATGVVSFTMQSGFLKEQLIDFLSNHPRVKAASNVVWKASDNYQWPSEFTVQGDSFEHALSKVLVPYKLEALFRPNNVVVIQPKQ